MTKEEFLNLDEEAQRGLIVDLAELWAKNPEHKEKRSAFISLANDEDAEKTKFSSCIMGTGALVIASILQLLNNHPELGMLLTKYLIMNFLKKNN